MGVTITEDRFVQMEVSIKGGYPQIINFSYKPSSELGVSLFMEPPKWLLIKKNMSLTNMMFFFSA